MSAGLPEVHLKEYYDKFYPSGLVLKWLKYNKRRSTVDFLYEIWIPATSEYLELREIAFILADDTHIRYKVILKEEEFKKELLRTLPHKIDIGAVYNYRVIFWIHLFSLIWFIPAWQEIIAQKWLQSHGKRVGVRYRFDRLRLYQILLHRCRTLSLLLALDGARRPSSRENLKEYCNNILL